MDQSKLRKVIKSGDDKELSIVLNEMLVSDNKYQRLMAEGAAVMMRRGQDTRKIAKQLLDGEVKSPRLYNRKLSEFANVWSGDVYKGWEDTEEGRPFRFKKYKPDNVPPTNLPSWLKPGDITITRIGGRISRYDPDVNPPRNAIFIGLKPGEEENFDVKALAYELQNRMDTGDLRLAGSMQQSIKVSNLKNIDFKQPPLEDQIKWARTLDLNQKATEAMQSQVELQKELGQAIMKDENYRPNFRRVFNLKNDSSMSDAEMAKAQETVNSIVQTYFTDQEIREFHRRGVHMRVAPLPEDIAGQNFGKEVILDPSTVKRADGITEDVVVHELIHAQNRFRDKDKPKIYLRKEAILDSPKDISNDAEIEEAVTEAMTSARLHTYDKASGTGVPTNADELHRKYNSVFKRMGGLNVSELDRRSQNKIRAALEEHYKMTAPDELIFSDNGFNYRLDEEDSRPSEGYWVYNLYDDSPGAPKNLDEMREFADPSIEVSLQMLMDGWNAGLEDYRYDSVEKGMKGTLSDLLDEIDVQDVVNADSLFEARQIGGRRYAFRVERKDVGNTGITEEEFLKIMNPTYGTADEREIALTGQDDTFVIDPMYDESGRFVVNPFDQYGDAYLDFINTFPPRGVDLAAEIDVSLGEMDNPPGETYVAHAIFGTERGPLEQNVIGHFDNMEEADPRTSTAWNRWITSIRPERAGQRISVEGEVIPISPADFATAWNLHPLYFEKDGEQYIKSHYDSDTQEMVYRHRRREGDKFVNDEARFFMFPTLDTDRDMSDLRLNEGDIFQRIYSRYKQRRRIDGKTFNLANRQVLSKSRADSLARFLRTRGLNARRIPVKGGFNLYWKGGSR